MKAYGGEEIQLHPFLRLAPVSFCTGPSWKKILQYLLCGNMCGLQSWSWCFGEEEKSVAPSRIGPQFLTPSQPQKLNGRLTVPIIYDWTIQSVLELQITCIFPVRFQRHIYICFFSGPKRNGLGGSGARGCCSSASDLCRGGECRVLNASYFRIFGLWNRNCILILWNNLF